jgi:Rps23 Pro-64 3,4-dihydroxylase Tpa1-like proline 4-hydroxylase
MEQNQNISLIQNIEEEEILKYNQKFIQKKIIQIKNILTYESAEEIYKYIFLHKNWNLSSGFDKFKFTKPIQKQFDKANELQIKNINDKFKNDFFTYMFHRTMNNNKPDYLEYLVRKQLNSPEFITIIKKITNLEISSLSTLFLSKYKPGHFLSPHSDKGNGKLAFVLNLSKFWKPQYGGILHFLDEDRQNIIDSYVPDFNNLILFEVPEDHDRPHFVSHIVPNIKHSRYAITGWYN